MSTEFLSRIGELVTYALDALRVRGRMESDERAWIERFLLAPGASSGA